MIDHANFARTRLAALIATGVSSSKGMHTPGIQKISFPVSR